MSKLFAEWLETNHQQIIDGYITFRLEKGDQRPSQTIQQNIEPAVILMRQAIEGDVEFPKKFKKMLYSITLQGLPLKIMEEATYLTYKSIQQILLAESPPDALAWLAQLGDIMLLIGQQVTEVVTMTLEQNQERQQTLLDMLPIRIFWKDTDLIYLGGNKLFAESAGFSSGVEVAGKRDEDMVWSAKAEIYQADDRAVLESGKSRIRFEKRQVRPDGTVVWTRTSKILWRNAHGDVIGLMGIYEDITAEKEAEQALKLAQASLDATADNLYWIAPDAKIIRVNQAVYDTLGYTPEEVENLTVFDIDPAFPPAAWPDHWQGLEEHKHLIIETKHQTKTGEVYPVEVRINYFEFDGQAYNFAAARDITERKEAQDRLEENNTMFQALLEYAATGLVSINLSGKIEMVNQQLKSMFGYEADELLGQSIDILLPEKFQAGHQRMIDSYFLNPEPRPMGMGRELIARRKDGSEFPVEISLSFAKTSTQQIGMASIIDLSYSKEVTAKEKRLQQEVLTAQNRLIQELSTPIIPLMDGIIVMPLIGSIDSMRARDLMRTMLKGISTHRAKIIILDVTGVSIVDTGIVGLLDRTIQAARLKGARTIVTGLSDAVAETIVDLGINWSNVETLRDLQTGLTVALKTLNIKLI